MNKINYDKSDPISIESYSQKLIGHTFREVESWDSSSEVNDQVFDYGDKRRKGGLGNLLEERFFGYNANSDSEPDFPEAGVELKASPYEINKKGELRAGERLVLTMIDYTRAVEPEFMKSHLWFKCKLILLVYYLRDRSVPSNLDYRIDYSRLFTPNAVDLAIIKQDYSYIIKKIETGKANELSEADTNYLGACTKGKNAIASTVPQAYYAPSIMARKRAFCYKVSYMTHVLNTYMIVQKSKAEPLIHDANLLKDLTFEQLIASRINRYVGKTDYELCKQFDIAYNNNKAQWSNLAFRMLGIKSNKAEEFEKAGIVVKAIRIEEDGRIKESMSFPTISFIKTANEEWEESDLFKCFNETKFLFVVYKKEDQHYILKGCQFWNMPYSDFEGPVHQGWEHVKKTINEGVDLLVDKNNGRTIISNNLLKASENPIIHVRPHASKSYYELGYGKVFGNGNISDSDELPDGRRMTKQCFWLNKEYVISILDDSLKE